MERNVKNQKTLISTIAAVLAAFVIYKLLGNLIDGPQTDSITNLFLKEIMFCVLVLIAAFATHRMWALKPKRDGFGTAILVGLWYLIQPLLALFLNWGLGTIEEVTVSASHIVLFAVTMLLIGINEELLFRGILLNGILEAFGEESPEHIRTAVFISAVVFGLLHIFNVFSGAALGGAIVQALANIATGALLGAAYVRSRKNLWPMVLLHAFMDTCALTVAGLLAGKDYASSVDSYSPIMLVASAVQLIVAIFALRTAKLLPLTENGKDEKTRKMTDSAKKTQKKSGIEKIAILVWIIGAVFLGIYALTVLLSIGSESEDTLDCLKQGAGLGIYFLAYVFGLLYLLKRKSRKAGIISGILYVAAYIFSFICQLAGGGKIAVNDLIVLILSAVMYVIYAVFIGAVLKEKQSTLSSFFIRLWYLPAALLFAVALIGAFWTELVRPDGFLLDGLFVDFGTSLILIVPVFLMSLVIHKRSLSDD